MAVLAGLILSSCMDPAAVGLGVSIYGFATRPEVAEEKVGGLRFSPGISPQGVMLSVGGDL